MTDYTQIPDLASSVYVAPLRKPAGLGDDWLEPAQRRYTAAEHRIWDELYARQIELMPGHACREFMLGLERLDLGRGGVPDFRVISEELEELFGRPVDLVSKRGLNPAIRDLVLSQARVLHAA